MHALAILAGALVALFGLLLLVRPQVSREWRHPLGQPLPHWAMRAAGLLLVAAGAVTLYQAASR
jgi:uncharacterized protein YjeT (DUF2065 family)